MTIQWPVARRQWRGARPYQEDAFRTLNIAGTSKEGGPALLMVLADGMGGEAGGSVASHIVVDSFTQDFAVSEGGIEAGFRHCLETATSRLLEREYRDRSLSGMGSTVVAALYDGRSIDWLSVGDSPMWLFVDGSLERLNEDHSMAPMLEDLVQKGALTPDQARKDRRRHTLRSAVTSIEPELVDCGRRACRLQPGEFVLIASDGLETLDEDRIAQELRSSDGSAEAPADALMSAVRAAGNRQQDNVTLLLLASGAPVGPDI